MPLRDAIAAHNRDEDDRGERETGTRSADRMHVQGSRRRRRKYRRPAGRRPPRRRCIRTDDARERVRSRPSTTAKRERNHPSGARLGPGTQRIERRRHAHRRTLAEGRASDEDDLGRATRPTMRAPDRRPITAIPRPTRHPERASHCRRNGRPPSRRRRPRDQSRRPNSTKERGHSGTRSEPEESENRNADEHERGTTDAPSGPEPRTGNARKRPHERRRPARPDRITGDAQGAVGPSLGRPGHQRERRSGRGDTRRQRVRREHHETPLMAAIPRPRSRGEARPRPPSGRDRRRMPPRVPGSAQAPNGGRDRAGGNRHHRKTARESDRVDSQDAPRRALDDDCDGRRIVRRRRDKGHPRAGKATRAAPGIAGSATSTRRKLRQTKRPAEDAFGGGTGREPRPTESSRRGPTGSRQRRATDYGREHRNTGRAGRWTPKGIRQQSMCRPPSTEFRDQAPSGDAR